MKKLIFLSVIFVFFACGNETKTETEQAEKSDNELISTEKTGEIGDCDEFLKKYEEWVDEIIKVYAQAKKNPLDLENSGKLVELSQEMAKWSQEWANLQECAQNEEFAARVEELQKKAEEAMGTLNENQ